MKKFLIIFLILVVAIICTFLFLDPYKNSKFGEIVIDEWFNYQDGDDDLGITRREIEGISSIESRTCEFIKKYKNNYIFQCTLEYKGISSSAIPFASNETLRVYAVYTPGKSRTYTYQVYNSNSDYGIWED